MKIQLVGDAGAISSGPVSGRIGAARGGGAGVRAGGQNARYVKINNHARFIYDSLTFTLKNPEKLPCTGPNKFA